MLLLGHDSGSISDRRNLMFNAVMIAYVIIIINITIFAIHTDLDSVSITGLVPLFARILASVLFHNLALLC